MQHNTLHFRQQNLDVQDMMTDRVITLPKRLTMAQAKNILGSKGITGAPVVEDDGRVCGIISMFDVLKALEEDDLEGPVAKRMTSPVIHVSPESSLKEALALFKKHGINRLPVLKHGCAVGILTPGDIVRKLAILLQLETINSTCEIADGNQLFWQQEFPVEAADFTKAGEVSTTIKDKLQKTGLRADVIRRIVVAAYEAEMNMVIHSSGGNFQVFCQGEDFTMIAQDTGPGIRDVARAMEEGFSTADAAIRQMGFGAGMGLPNIRRCVDKLDIKSIPGVGTTVKMVIQIKE